MELFFDTETSGFITDKLPIDHHDQAWVVQLGFILSDSQKIYHEANIMIKGGDRKMGPYAEKVHGISVETSNKFGILELEAFDLFESLLRLKPTLIAHNKQFDLKFMNSISMRYRGNCDLIKSLPSICTMMESTNYCKLEKKRGSGYKWPKLEELHKILFDFDFDNAHDALADVHATRNCFYKLVELGVIEYEI